MRKINPCSLTSKSLFAVPLEQLIPESYPKRVILDKLPWDELVEIAKKAYHSHYWKNKPNPRIMIGLFVWSTLSDKTYREVAEDCSFNRLCAYACGFKTDDFRRKIDHSTLIKFDQHLGEENILKIKDIIEKLSIDNQPPNSKGRHSADPTVFEANITYPTDTKIMEQVRKFLVDDIIKPYQKKVNENHRHYDRVARREYLNFAKKRNVTADQINKIKKKQLQFLKRNITQAEQVMRALEETQLKGKLNKKSFKKLKIKLLLAKQIYAQQYAIWKGEKIKERIVSFHRPNVRPIFRGKARAKTEFGLKAELSVMGKALILGKTSYDNFYDGNGLKESILEMKEKNYPVKEVVGDRGNQGLSNFLKNLAIVNALEVRGKRTQDPPISKKRFTRARNKTEGAGGILKRVFVKVRLRARTDLGDLIKICKAFIGYNLTYAF